MDLRLLTPAVVAWATAFVCTQLREVPGWLPIAAALVATGLVAVALWRSATRRVRGGIASTLAVSVAICCAVAAATVAAGADRRPGALESAASSSRVVGLRVELTGEPRPLDGPGALAVVDVLVREVAADDAATSGLRAPAVLFVAGAAPDLAAGSVLGVAGRVEHGNDGEHASFVLRAVGDPPTDSSAPSTDVAHALRTGFVELSGRLPGDGASLLPGLAVGDTSLVDDALDDRMKAASLSHLTAVSGANCALVVGAAFGLLALFAAPRWARVSASLVALAGFVVLVTPEPSVVRAAVMAAIVLVAIAVGRPSAGVPVLGLAVVVILMGDPWLSRSFGFALSAAATAGLLVLAGPLTRVLGRILPSPIAAALSLPLAAQLACQPVIVLLDPTVPVWGIPANMLAAPAAPAATVLGMVACLVLPLAPVLASGVAVLAWLPSQWIAGVATAAASAPGGRLPWPSGLLGVLGWLVVLAVVILAVAPGRLRRVAAGTLVLGVASYVALVGGIRLGELWSRPTDWTVAMCDVGQGDAVVVRSAGRIALIDTGPAPEPLNTCLADLGIDHVDLLVLSHFDLDHIGGAAAVVGRTTEVRHPPVREPSEAETLQILAEGGARVVETTAGSSGSIGTLPWRALWPPADEPRFSGNDGSVVIEFGGELDAIFLGDLGADSELALLADGHVGDGYAIVKFAHHGSADQYPALYERISARLALVSCGIDNDYGHPTRTALTLLERGGTAVARSDRDGMTLVALRDGSLDTWSSGPGVPPD